MIDKSKLQVLPTTGPQKAREAIGWEGMSVEDLMAYRDEITAALKKKIPLSLMDLDLEQELLLQFATVRALQTDVVDDEETPANQRATVANTVSSCLTQLINLQEAIYTPERFKRIEAALIRWLSAMPTETAKPLLDDYATMVRSLGGK